VRPRDGSDLIFVTGAPGSKWSLIAQALEAASEVEADGTDAVGPAAEYGKELQRHGGLDRDALRAELGRSGVERRGLELVTSHVFTRDLPYLAETFPAARFVLVYRPDESCLDWWLEAGGFDMSFPDYSWYRELESMKKEIVTDNAALLDFTERHELPLRRLRSLKPLLAALGLTYASDEEALHARARQVKLAYFRGSEAARG
jgi:hypothetical protein